MAHNTCAALEEWVRSNCLIMFLNGTGEPFFKSSPSGCSGFHRRVRAVNGRGVFSLVLNKPFPDLRYKLGSRRFAMHRVKPLCCWYPTMNISCPQPRKGGRIEWVSGVQFGTSTGTRSRITPRESRFSKSRAMPASGRGGQGNQPIWMFVAAKGAEAHQHSEWTVKKIAGVRSLARAVQRRATVTLDMAEQYPNKSFWVSHVAVPRKHLGLEECIELPAHVLVAGRRAGSVKCTTCLQVCVNKNPRFWLPTARTRWQAKNTPFHPCCSRVHLTLIRHRQPRKWGEDCWARIFLWFRGYELQRRKGVQERQTENEEMRQQQVIKIRTDMTRKIKSKVRMDAKKQLAVGDRNGSGSPGSRERPHKAPNFPPPGCVKCGGSHHVGQPQATS